MQKYFVVNYEGIFEFPGYTPGLECFQDKLKYSSASFWVYDPKLEQYSDDGFHLIKKIIKPEHEDPEKIALLDQYDHEKLMLKLSEMINTPDNNPT